MEANTAFPNDTKDVFEACRTCSRTFAFLLNRAFWHPREPEERALNPMAGGIMNLGYQCGMLWGAALSVGAESYRRHKTLRGAIESAVSATAALIQSFTAQTGTTNCRDIIGVDLSTKIGMAKHILKIQAQGIQNSLCFNLAERWAPLAIKTSSEAVGASLEGQGANTHKAQAPLSCASEVVGRMGGGREEMAIVAGFAGGLGLSGGGCGALSAVIWKKMLDWCRENPDKDPPYFNNKAAKKILKAFKSEANGRMRCREICKRSFRSLHEHTLYLREGGCKSLMDAMVVASEA